MTLTLTRAARYSQRLIVVLDGMHHRRRVGSENRWRQLAAFALTETFGISDQIGLDRIGSSELLLRNYSVLYGVVRDTYYHKKKLYKRLLQHGF